MMLANLLDRALSLIWPQRQRQEALLDLGEQKGWQDDDRGAALQRVAHWLLTTGVVGQVADLPDVLPLLPRDARQRAARFVEVAPLRESVGVAGDLVTLAPLLGTTPKTLANGLSRGLRPDRPDHRWLLLLARLAEPTSLMADLPYHQRSVAAVGGLLGRLRAHVDAGQPDAVDALVVLSLLALWQRRRPTTEVRAHRGRARARRSTPIPLAKVAGDLMADRQVEVLLDPQQTRVDGQIALVVFEAAFTLAHLEPRAPRIAPPPASVRWPERLHRALTRHDIAAFLDQGSLGSHLRHRLAILEAWRVRQPWPHPPPEIADHPHVRFGAALAYLRSGGALAAGDREAMLVSDWPGRAMLAPLLKERLEAR